MVRNAAECSFDWNELQATLTDNMSTLCFSREWLITLSTYYFARGSGGEIL